jgi:hypothetical protein
LNRRDEALFDVPDKNEGVWFALFAVATMGHWSQTPCQPEGAKFPPNIRISPRNGSAI